MIAMTKGKESRGRRLRLILVLVGFTCLAGWQGYNFYQENCHYRETRFLFDTEVFIEAHGWGAKRAVIESLGRMEELHRKVNRFSPESEIYLINKQAGQEPVEVSDLTFNLVEQSLRIAGITNGAFNPTIAPLVELWAFGESASQRVPPAEDINTALKLVGCQKVLLDKEQRTVYLAEKGMGLDMGAIAKGYAVEQAVSILKNNNISSALVTAGGNIYALGEKQDSRPWQIGIRNPLHKDKVLGYVRLENEAIDTSGDYERFFWADGQKYCHILDPRTGYPVQGISGCTVIADDSTDADAFATAVFVLGEDEGLEIIEQQGLMGLLVTSDGQVVLSEDMEAKFRQ